MMTNRLTISGLQSSLSPSGIVQESCVEGGISYLTVPEIDTLDNYLCLIGGRRFINVSGKKVEVTEKDEVPEVPEHVLKYLKYMTTLCLTVNQYKFEGWLESQTYDYDPISSRITHEKIVRTPDLHNTESRAERITDTTQNRGAQSLKSVTDESERTLNGSTDNYVNSFENAAQKPSGSSEYDQVSGSNHDESVQTSEAYTDSDVKTEHEHTDSFTFTGSETTVRDLTDSVRPAQELLMMEREVLNFSAISKIGDILLSCLCFAEYEYKDEGGCFYGSGFF